MKLKVAAIPLLLMLVMQVRSAISDEPSEHSIKVGIAKLQELANEKEGFFQRREVLSGLSETVFPPEVLEFYTTQLRLGNTGVLRDIANVRGLWADSFMLPLQDMLVNIDNLRVANEVMDVFDLHHPFDPLIFDENDAIVRQLNDLGRFSVERLEKDHQQIAMAARLHNWYVLPNLRELLGCHRLSQKPSELSLPPVRICDCAHDAIVSLCRGNLEARIAVAYHKVNITNKFDPRKLVVPITKDESSVGRRLEEVEKDEEVVFDPRPGNKKLFQEIVLVRDEMIRQLIADLNAEGTR